ncbi:MAG: DUF4150 domain-containing protein [Methylomicrobium sp.]|nr:DUF4150 domain-containing protein [Methylomicrobium sp.]
MANKVFANGRELACKAGSGKTICAFPDVCFTPPENPATPPGVPIPYPNTGFASDTTKGSKHVKISGKEIMLKNKSYFKTSAGDEAGCAAKKGIITSKNKGKVYFQAWSMDVKFEGQNVDRHLDLTTNNHASMPGDTPPWPFTDTMTAAQTADCEKDREKEEKSCSEDGESRGKETKYKSAEECCNDADCQKARNCMLVPYGGAGSPNCCKEPAPPKTAHHLLPNSLLQSKRGDNATNVPGLNDTYNVNDGPCVCVVGGGHDGDHGALHDKAKDKLRTILEKGDTVTYKVAKAKVVEAHSETFPGRCNPDCIAAQIDASLEKHKTGENIEVRQKDGITRKNFDKYKNDGVGK